MFQSSHLLISTILITCLASCAQNKYLSEETQADVFATFTVQMPGNIPVDAHGNEIEEPRAKKYTVYLETSSAENTWIDAWIGNEHFTLESGIVENFPFNAGTKKSTDQKIMIARKQDNFLWQLKLHPAYDQKTAPEKVSGNVIILQGNKDGKKVTRQINKIIEIEALPAV